jgi:hypothetical protein
MDTVTNAIQERVEAVKEANQDRLEAEVKEILQNLEDSQETN